MLKPTLTQEQQQSEDVRARMLLTEYSLKYIVPLVVQNNDSVRNFLLAAIAEHPKAREIFDSHLEQFCGKVP